MSLSEEDIKESITSELIDYLDGLAKENKESIKWITRKECRLYLEKKLGIISLIRYKKHIQIVLNSYDNKSHKHLNQRYLQRNYNDKLRLNGIKQRILEKEINEENKGNRPKIKTTYKSSVDRTIISTKSKRRSSGRKKAILKDINCDNIPIIRHLKRQLTESNADKIEKPPKRRKMSSNNKQTVSDQKIENLGKNVFDYFTKCSHDIRILDDGKTITKYKNNNDWNNTTYGNQWIHAKYDQIVKWKLKINKISVEKDGEEPIAKNRIMFGLVTKVNRVNDESFYDDDDQPYYGISNTMSLFIADNDEFYEQIDNEELHELNDHDVITLILNTQEQVLSIEQDGNEYVLVKII